MSRHTRSCTRQEVERSVMRTLYGVSLADMGQKLAAQLAELSARPTRDGCDRMVRELAEATTAVHRMRERLDRAA